MFVALAVTLAPTAIDRPVAVHVPFVTVVEPSKTPFSKTWIVVPFGSLHVPDTDVTGVAEQIGPFTVGVEVVPFIVTELLIPEKHS